MKHQSCGFQMRPQGLLRLAELLSCESSQSRQLAFVSFRLLQCSQLLAQPIRKRPIRADVSDDLPAPTPESQLVDSSPRRAGFFRNKPLAGKCRQVLCRQPEPGEPPSRFTGTTEAGIVRI